MALTSAPGEERVMRGSFTPPSHRRGGQGLPEEELSGGDEACLLGAHGVWPGPELRHSVGTHPEDKRGDPGGLHVQVLRGVLARRGRGHPPPPDPGRQGHLAAGVGRAAGGPLQPLGEGAAGVLPPGGALGPVAGRLRCGPESPPV